MSIDPLRLFQGEAFGEIVLGAVYQDVADKNDGMRAVTDARRGYVFGPMDWPRDGAALPHAGDEIVLVFPTNADGPRCVLWAHYPNT